ncbi:tetratricopeptide repeat protein [Estrella lausannensis]|nr:tetratricopeptide repeat protein [Estrella lausannensis]
MQPLQSPHSCKSSVHNGALEDSSERLSPKENKRQRERIAKLGLLEMEAGRGDLPSALALARIYYFGKDAAEDKKKAFRYFQMAADLGSDEARNSLGVMLLRGEGGPLDKTAARRQFKWAAQNGHGRALYNYGICLLNSNSSTKAQKILDIFTSCAETLNIREGYSALGILYYEGRIVTKDLEKSIRLFSLASDKGCAFAKRCLSVILLTKKSSFAERMKGLDHLKCLAALGGPQDQYDYATACLTYGSGLSYQRAFFEYCTMAAAAGHLPALYQLALHFEEGDGVEPNISLAKKLYRLASDQNCKISLIRLTNLNADELGVPDTPAHQHSLDWHMRLKLVICELNAVLLREHELLEDSREAIYLKDKQDPHVRYLLGCAFYSGRGVERDRALAREHFRQAALRSHLEARHRLAKMLWKGEGGVQDKNEALFQLKMASKCGHEQAFWIYCRLSMTVKKEVPG